MTGEGVGAVIRTIECGGGDVPMQRTAKCMIQDNETHLVLTST